MLLTILRVTYLMICIGAILAYINPEEVEGQPGALPGIIENNKLIAFCGLLFLTQIVTVVDLFFRKKRIEAISAVYFGILIGVLLAYLMNQALTPIVKPPYTDLCTLFTLLVFPYFLRVPAASDKRRFSIRDSLRRVLSRP